MTDLQERSDTIRARLRNDIVTSLRIHLGQMFAPSGELLDALTEDAMHHVDKLLADAVGWKQVDQSNMYVCKGCGNVGWMV